MRGVVRPSARSRFSFPCGFAPGFNPNHIALKGPPAGLALVSLVAAVGSPTFIRVDRANLGTSNGTNSNGFNATGHYVSFPAVASQNNFITFPLQTAATTAPTVITQACIFTLTTAATSAVENVLININNNAFGGGFGSGLEVRTTSNTVFLTAAGSGGVVNSGINLSLNVPYFISVSYTASSQNFAVTNLQNGQIKTAHTATGMTIGAQGNPGWAFGGANGNSFSGGSGGQFNTAMMAVNGALLGLQELVQWASDPWSFWYPDASSRVGAAAAAPTNVPELALLGVGM